MRFRYLTLAVGVSMLILSLVLVLGGRIAFSFVPRIDSDVITARAVLPFGVSIEEARRVQDLIVRGANEVLQKEGEEISKGVYTRIGYPLASFSPVTGVDVRRKGSHLIGACALSHY